MHTGRSLFFAGAVAGALVMAVVLNAGRVIARGGGQASKYTANGPWIQPARRQEATGPQSTQKLLRVLYAQFAEPQVSIRPSSRINFPVPHAGLDGNERHVAVQAA
jgi:hypothetical protein